MIFLVLESTSILFEPLQCTGFYGVIVETRAFSHCTPASPMIIFLQKWTQFNENIAISNNLVHFTRNRTLDKLTTVRPTLGDHRENAAADWKRSRQTSLSLSLSLFALYYCFHLTKCHQLRVHRNFAIKDGEKFWPTCLPMVTLVLALPLALVCQLLELPGVFGWLGHHWWVLPSRHHVFDLKTWFRKYSINCPV